MKTHNVPFWRFVSRLSVGLFCVCLLLAGCGPSDTTDKKASSEKKKATAQGAREIVLFCGMEPSLAKPLIRLFEEQYGIRVNAKFGESRALATELSEQGEARVLADVVWLDTPAAMEGVVDPSGESRLQPISRDLLIKVNADLRSREARWMGISARLMIPVQAPVSGAPLPKDPLELVKPTLNLPFGYADTRDFEYLVAWMNKKDGKVTTDWITRSLVRERRYERDADLLNAIALGQAKFGFVGHDTLLAYQRAEPFRTRRVLPVAAVADSQSKSLVMLHAAGLTSSSTQVENSEKFIGFLIGDAAQQYLAGALLLCPVAENVVRPDGMITADDLQALVRRQAETWPTTDDLSKVAKVLRENNITD